ncbi:pyridoxamine 5'-phosphate oxidase family protein [Streptomyces sp. WMMB 322]|uniref:pyridoxamine 5'-phosphate oxidase family protein n=1 Tax=Streptomyces sp. WMMB 322 TaxID=1286821 RepID=UPI0008237B4F|nr:pyridoxamine 5'-phosphate oxidase family protein [Streptomyces sp. WMMB 322]SCK38164.1 Pyridoxamine 5'-phosphate oxidase [Streptomyces sp. WMMB 322]
MTSMETHPPEPSAASPLDAFWRERRYATLTTLRPDGTPHVVPVSVTYEPGPPARPDGPAADTTAQPDAPAKADATPGAGPARKAVGTARVVTRRHSRKARNIAAAGEAGMRVALCQVDGGRWSTLEGRARIRTDAESVADAERRYEERYGRRPTPNPERVLIEITVDRTLGMSREA